MQLNLNFKNIGLLPFTREAWEHLHSLELQYRRLCGTKQQLNALEEYLLNMYRIFSREFERIVKNCTVSTLWQSKLYNGSGYEMETKDKHIDTRNNQSTDIAKSFHQLFVIPITFVF